MILQKLWDRKFINQHLSMVHEDPKIFAKSQWQRTAGTSVFYLLVRYCFLIFFFTTWTISVVDEENLSQPESFRVKWMIYLTNWGYTMCTLQALLSVIITTCSFLPDRGMCIQGTAVTSKLYKIYWACNVIAIDVGMAITIIFWSVIYEPSDEGIAAMNLIVHAFNSVVMLVDLCIVAHPVRLLHSYWTIVFGTCYVIFSMVYYFAGGTTREGNTYIYKILDWDNPGTTVLVCLGVLIFLVVLHIFTYLIYRLRTLLARKLFGAGVDIAQIPGENGKTTEKA